MKRLASLCLLLLSAGALSAQSSSLTLVDSTDSDGAGVHAMRSWRPEPASSYRPFSRTAFGGGISPMGVSLSSATILNRYMNLRGTGNIFNYSVNNFTTNGFTANGKLNLASAGTSIDIYPFPNHGLRFSPGVLFYNQNRMSAVATVAAGQSFTLNNATYYSSRSNPVTATANLGLNTRKQALTATTGWGNMISRRGGHWSFPVELGAAFIGSPSLNMTLAGTACDQTGVYCVDVAQNQQIQANLQAQVAKYRKDLDPLKTYPIASFGVAYSFKTRAGR
ncbi:hypothetical protein DYQ86_27120 [Acidobacteria bacterium AB60]|nr:hypothetical protein DYQ86_27120 [Acidobacteria bacterium AB60]